MENNYTKEDCLKLQRVLVPTKHTPDGHFSLNIAIDSDYGVALLWFLATEQYDSFVRGCVSWVCRQNGTCFERVRKIMETPFEDLPTLLNDCSKCTLDNSRGLGIVSRMIADKDFCSIFIGWRLDIGK